MVFTADDGSIPAETEKEKQAILIERQQFEMHSYYPYIKQYTPLTQFIPITFEQTQALRVYFRTGKVQKPAEFDSLNPENKEKEISDEKGKEKEGENVDLFSAFDEFKSNIQKAIDEMSSTNENKEEEKGGGEKENKFFIRLSTRSPKDAVDKPPFREKLQVLLQLSMCFL